MNLDKIKKNYLGPEETQERVKRALSLVLICCKPQNVILFGSAARGELTASSDIDMVVVLKECLDLKSLFKILSAKKAELPFDVDFFLVDENTFAEKSQIGGVFFDAFWEGKVLYP